MKKIFSAVTVASLLAGGGLLVTAPQAQADTVMEDAKAVFTCKIVNNQYATVPQIVRDEVDAKYSTRLIKRTVLQEKDPMIIWTTSLDSDDPAGLYTPDGRCEAVSARLTNLAASMTLDGLVQLSRDSVTNNERVIAISETPSYWVPGDEVIFTLSPSNRKYHKAIHQIFQLDVADSFGVGGPPSDEIIPGLSPIPIVE